MVLNRRCPFVRQRPAACCVPFMLPTLLFPSCQAQLCKEGPNCRRPVCFFAHSVLDLRQPSHMYDPSAGGPEVRGSASLSCCCCCCCCCCCEMHVAVGMLECHPGCCARLAVRSCRRRHSSPGAYLLCCCCCCVRTHGGIELVLLLSRWLLIELSRAHWTVLAGTAGWDAICWLCCPSALAWPLNAAPYLLHRTCRPAWRQCWRSRRQRSSSRRQPPWLRQRLPARLRLRRSSACPAMLPSSSACLRRRC